MGDPVTTGIVMSAVSTAVGAVQAKSQARAQQRAQQAATNRQVQARRMEQQRREKEMREQAKRNQATARASFGARGVSSTGGSANALLQGIQADTDDAIADDRRALDFNIESLRENQRAQQRLNLLETRNSILNSVIGTGGKVLSSIDAPAKGTGHADQITW
ncbi:MAG: hypothetical protein JJ900_11700 [Rhodospirillales bacterium]|nr:hypothetical protein [Rhodospirillales bacterium]MBO6787505.1 hypothetical protein [Rhodospirillales bacterium]